MTEALTLSLVKDTSLGLGRSDLHVQRKYDFRQRFAHGEDEVGRFVQTVRKRINEDRIDVAFVKQALGGGDVGRALDRNDLWMILKLIDESIRGCVVRVADEYLERDIGEHEAAAYLRLPGDVIG